MVPYSRKKQTDINVQSLPKEKSNRKTLFHTTCTPKSLYPIGKDESECNHLHMRHFPTPAPNETKYTCTKNSCGGRRQGIIHSWEVVTIYILLSCPWPKFTSTERFKRPQSMNSSNDNPLQKKEYFPRPQIAFQNNSPRKVIDQHPYLSLSQSTEIVRSGNVASSILQHITGRW